MDEEFNRFEIQKKEEKVIPHDSAEDADTAHRNPYKRAVIISSFCLAVSIIVSMLVQRSAFILIAWGFALLSLTVLVNVLERYYSYKEKTGIRTNRRRM